MKPFRFTLEALRTVRQRQEEAALEQYGRALLARQQAGQRLTQAQHRLAAAWQERQELLAAGGRAAEVQRVQRCGQLLEVRCRECEKAFQEATLAVERRRQQYFAARRQREIVDHCRDKQRLRYDQEWAREEQKLLDEMALRQVDAAAGATLRLNEMLWN